MNNIYHPIIAQININSIRNKFDVLVKGIQGNMDILKVFETKPIRQFVIKRFRAR